MADPLSDKAIAQAFREAFDTPTRDPHEYASLFRINQRARELDAASHGEVEFVADICGSCKQVFDKPHNCPHASHGEDEARVEARCGNCAFYKDRGEKGECRRRSPCGARAQHPEYAVWPWVSYYDTCGDFMARAALAAKGE